MREPAVIAWVPAPLHPPLVFAPHASASTPVKGGGAQGSGRLIETLPEPGKSYAATRIRYHRPAFTVSERSDAKTAFAWHAASPSSLQATKALASAP